MSKGGVPGHIRGWQYAYGESTSEGAAVAIKTSLLTYQVGRNRWCGHIGG